MTTKLPVLNSRTDFVQLEPFSLPSEPFVPSDVAPLSLTRQDVAARNALRTSSYVIYVDLPGNPDEMLLIQSYTGAYDLVSKRVATFVRSREIRHAPKPLFGDWTGEPAIDGEIPTPSDDIIASLRERGYLVSLTLEEEESLFVKVAAARHFSALRHLPVFVIMPTYQCNLRCSYCFQDHMRTDPKMSHLLRILDRPMADRILTGMGAIDRAHGIEHYEAFSQQITLFGGEPLLAESKDIVSYLLERFAERGKMRVMAVTNGTDLASYRDVLGPEQISALQITLDGPPDEHDSRRIYADGSGSFSRIAENISMALECGVNVQIRMNVDRNNIQSLPALADEFHTRGWLNDNNFVPYVAPVHAANEKTSARTTFNSWQLQKAMTALVEEHPRLQSFGLNDDALQRQARRIFEDRSQQTMPAFRSAFCGANSTMYVIDAFADIYACWERTGEPDIRIGRIDKSGDVFMNRTVLEKWRSRNVVSNQVCRKCRYATSCGGGCPILAEEASGSLFSNYCDGYAKRFRASVANAYQDFVQGTTLRPEADSPCDV